MIAGVNRVGMTAVRVAAARSMETHRRRGLLDDPLAEAFVRAAAPGGAMPTRLDDPSLDEDGRVRWGRLADLLGARSAFYDEELLDATGRRGVDQVVALAAGLDSRAFRLAWPPGCDLHEIDQPDVIEFKNGVVGEQGVPARCRRHTIGIDLREDWTVPLLETGFDPARATVWLAEGLLPYLPAAAEESLFDRVNALSAPGSRIAFDRVRDIAQAVRGPLFGRAPWHRGHAGRVWNTEPRRDPASWLTAAGWTVTALTPHDLGRRYLSRYAPGTPPPGRHGEYLKAERPR